MRSPTQWKTKQMKIKKRKGTNSKMTGKEWRMFWTDVSSGLSLSPLLFHSLFSFIHSWAEFNTKLFLKKKRRLQIFCKFYYVFLSRVSFIAHFVSKIKYLSSFCTHPGTQAMKMKKWTRNYPSRIQATSLPTVCAS